MSADALASAVRDEGCDLVQRLQDRSTYSVFDMSMVSRLMVGKYKNKHRGVPFMKDVVSQHLYRETIQKLKPKTIIELGTAFGGAALWLADNSDAHIVTFDIEDIRHPECKEDSRVAFFELDVCDFEKVKGVLSEMPHPWLVSEDCHVDASLIMKTLDPLMEQGDYVIFEDTHPSNPDKSGMSAETEYECESWAREKLDSVMSAMSVRPSFMIDCGVQDMYGYNGCTHVNSVFVKK